MLIGHLLKKLVCGILVENFALLTFLNADFSKFYKYNLFIIIVEIEINTQEEIVKRGKCS
ncbi:hypothetical protein ACFVSW_05935 [Neobacillus sp. NPDC058068]|uniref:hypothetical protein n=1 Tax=Neobacillus sp. NPDC058068 TaxID=3346325 RepID=UPI0036D9C7B8